MRCACQRKCRCSEQNNREPSCGSMHQTLLLCNDGVQHPASSRRTARKAGLPGHGQLALGYLEVLRCTSACIPDQGGISKNRSSAHCSLAEQAARAAQHARMDEEIASRWPQRSRLAASIKRSISRSVRQFSPRQLTVTVSIDEARARVARQMASCSYRLLQFQQVRIPIMNKRSANALQLVAFAAFIAAVFAVILASLNLISSQCTRGTPFLPSVFPCFGGR